MERARAKASVSTEPGEVGMPASFGDRHWCQRLWEQAWGAAQWPTTPRGARGQGHITEGLLSSGKIFNFTPLKTNRGGAIPTQLHHWWLSGLYCPWSRAHYRQQMLNSRSCKLQEGALNSWFEGENKS